MGSEISTNQTEVPGLGSLPAYFYGTFDGFNLEEYSNATNSHNENNFYAECNRDDWVNDEFDISGAALGDGYVLTVNMNSDADIPIYNEGYVTLSYDAKTQKWTTLSGTAEGHLWRFCTSTEVVDAVISGLKCYVSDQYVPNGIKNTIEKLIPSLESSANTLAASTAIYAGDDCNVVNVSFSDAIRYLFHRAAAFYSRSERASEQKDFLDTLTDAMAAQY